MRRATSTSCPSRSHGPISLRAIKRCRNPRCVDALRPTTRDKRVIEGAKRRSSGVRQGGSEYVFRLRSPTTRHRAMSKRQSARRHLVDTVVHDHARERNRRRQTERRREDLEKSEGRETTPKGPQSRCVPLPPPIVRTWPSRGQGKPATGDQRKEKERHKTEGKLVELADNSAILPGNERRLACWTRPSRANMWPPRRFLVVLLNRQTRRNQSEQREKNERKGRLRSTKPGKLGLRDVEEYQHIC
jgi:hypothetical protein